MKKGSVCLNDDEEAKLSLKEIKIYFLFDLIKGEYTKKSAPYSLQTGRTLNNKVL
ncbi:hypothetical protein LOS22_06955 [Enterococcus faecium]|nr:hypothetical protein [Enterococcus faecium]